ncbi:pseudaminic acid synthase [Paraclostridium sordellii]|uniref:pseudaminic acid synthase n=1 Tax=Paraclostridium sordellii TaxID=1505 RepID=UPI0022DF062B|nr:pseudaminic acid synthase [Paeniclostridium sordellii]
MIINNFKIDESSPCYIVGEISANHGQDINLAIESIYTLKECGANAIKIQTYTPDTLTIDCDNDYFKINNNTLWDGTTLYSLYKKAYTPWDWHEKLFDYARSIGITLFSTPFDKSSVDFLESLNVPAYKIASFEIKDIPLIEYVASKNKPIIMSTGIATLSDIYEALNACKKYNNFDVALLKCTSSYPSKLEDANLNTICDMKNKFNTLVGLSDHSIDLEVPLTAVSLGAKVIEKHFIIDKSIDSPDREFSLDKKEFKNMVDSIRKVEKALGCVSYNTESDLKKHIKFSRSLFVVKDIKKGDILTEDNIKSIRPGYGIEPKYYFNVLGKKVNKDLKRGTPLSFCDLVK